MGEMGIDCEICGAPATDERKDRWNGHVRIMSVCDDCAHGCDVAEELDRREADYERAVDQSLAEWKDEGKVGWPRPVRRRR